MLPGSRRILDTRVFEAIELKEALLLFGMSILFRDHFSEERAAVYHARIIEALK